MTHDPKGAAQEALGYRPAEEYHKLLAPPRPEGDTDGPLVPLPDRAPQRSIPPLPLSTYLTMLQRPL